MDFSRKHVCSCIKRSRLILLVSSPEHTIIPDCSVSDFRVDYSFEAIKVFSRIENIFDKYYEILDGYPGAPRIWIIGE